MEETVPVEGDVGDNPDIQADVPAKILVVDDNLFIRNTTITILKKEKFAVIEAADGHEAVDIAIAERPDLILMDLSMPKLDGFKAMEELKNHPDTKNIPIIIMTAYAAKDQVIKANQLGIAGFIVKPFNIDTLIETVKKKLLPRST